MVPLPSKGRTFAVTDARSDRQRLIAEIIRAEPIGSQEELSARLAERGLAVTQATVSRDLEQLGAIKVKRGGQLSYALPDQIAASDWSAGRLERILKEWVLSVEDAAGIVVLKTPPGSAHIVALAFDQAKLAQVAGCISGDDTVFLAVRDIREVGRLAGELRKMAEGAAR
jgi:transcriptional regulator of arginine metabolism